MPKSKDRKPSIPSRIAWRVLRALYRARGYRLLNRPPQLDKFVLIGAPHTSNWDFVVFAGIVHEVGINPSFIGKHTLFRWPMTRFMYDMGGMPIDRSSARGFVSEVVDQVRAADAMALVIAPEGSRSSDGRWRSGFYHIAAGAGVPIVCAWMDEDSRRAGFSDAIVPTGDFHADLGRIAAFYRRAMPDCPRFDVLAEQATGEVATPARPVDPAVLAPPSQSASPPSDSA